MKEINKTIKKEIVDDVTLYEAADGTQFRDKAECLKYEQSAAGVLMARVKEFTIAECDDSELFYMSEDSKYRTLVPKTQEHLDILNQLYFIFEGREKREERFTQKHINGVILLGYRFCGGDLDWVWFYSLDHIIKTITGDSYILMPKP